MPATIRGAICAALLLLPWFLLTAQDAGPPSRAQIGARLRLPSDGDRLRGQLDAVGFVVTQPQAEDLLGCLMAEETPALAEQDDRLGMTPESDFIGGVCPHDDHLYAGRLYLRLTERIAAPRVILLGVFHKARLWNLEGRLVFDEFEAWHGPWGDVPVDALRAELLESLPAEDVVVDNGMHEAEHSLEAIVPFLEHRNRDVRIVPILVPYMGWERLTELSDQFSAALSAAMKRHGWRLGRDVAILISSDAVHYGPDFDHAPFGTDAAAYLAAVERDRRLARATATGPLAAQKARELFSALVDEKDVRSYRLPWCGRFSIPLGLEVIRRTAARLSDPVPVGHLLGYETSLSSAEPRVSPETRKAGLGYTAPSNFHHWVGYASVGFLQGE